MKKQYTKAKLIAKNLPTGTYAASCPMNSNGKSGKHYALDRDGRIVAFTCSSCEIAK